MTEQSEQALTPEQLAVVAETFDVVREGAADELVGYLDAGVPANLTNDRGDTLLILAAYHTHPACVRLLLDRGADTGRVNDAGQTALAAAAFRQHEEIVTMLLDAGADPAAGPKSAYAITEYFDLPQMRALLDRGR